MVPRTGTAAAVVVGAAVARGTVRGGMVVVVSSSTALVSGVDVAVGLVVVGSAAVVTAVGVGVVVDGVSRAAEGDEASVPEHAVRRAVPTRTAARPARAQFKTNSYVHGC